MIVTAEHDFGENNLSFPEELFEGMDGAKIAEIFWSSPAVIENFFLQEEVWLFVVLFFYSV